MVFRAGSLEFVIAFYLDVFTIITLRWEIWLHDELMIDDITRV
jgi:hypothetical protein